MKILSVTSNLSRYGGAQKVMMDLHLGLKTVYSPKVLSFQSYDKLHKSYEISQNEFLKFKNPFQLKDSILIVHSRNLIPFFVFLKKMFFLNTRIIYVSHNVYSTYKNLTFFPNEVVSISNKVTENLTDYFNLNPNRISLIYNGLKDFGIDNQIKPFLIDNIKILYPARVNSVKRQLSIVKALKGKLSPNIQILFAGVGDEFEKLKEICDNKQFIALGFVSDIHSLIRNVDYLMLFSIQEGLPLSLIEGLMHAKPLIVNDVGGNLEIGIPEYNAFFLDENFNNLSNQLNRLLEIDLQTYHKMSQNSRQHYLKNFQYKTMVNNYIQLISSKSEK